MGRITRRWGGSQEGEEDHKKVRRITRRWGGSQEDMKNHKRIRIIIRGRK